MKNKITGLLLVAVLLTITAFASGGKGTINEKMHTTFHQQFADAKEVKWANKTKYVKVTFKLHDQVLHAFFTRTGDLMGISRNIARTQLPINLQSKLKKYSSKGWITELVEFAGNEETTYYALVEDADQKITLKSSGSTTWSVSKTEKKS